MKKRGGASIQAQSRSMSRGCNHKLRCGGTCQGPGLGLGPLGVSINAARA